MIKKYTLIVIAGLILADCSKNRTVRPLVKLTAASLTAPAQNQVCTTGTIISDTQSTILFTWLAAENASSYHIVIKNLLTSDSTSQNTAQLQLSINLLRNTPYSWYVVSESATATVKSTIWKFYNSGPGAVNYAPFPAEITSPTFAQNVSAVNGTVNLTWTGSSVLAGTVTNYDIYFGTTTAPSILKSALNDSFLDSVPVTSKNTYYWKVITRDLLGDTSDSGLYQFTVK